MMSSPNVSRFEFLSLQEVDPQLTKESLTKLYNERVQKWKGFFDKWSTYDGQEAEKEFEVDDIEDWRIDEPQSDGGEETVDSGNEQGEEEPEEVNAAEEQQDEDDFESIKSAVREVQSGISIEEVDDMLCTDCGTRTFLPFEYMDAVGKSLCDNCTIKDSGHEECEVPDCQTCINVANQLLNRREVSKLFRERKLIVVRDTSQEEMLLNRSMPLPKAVHKISPNRRKLNRSALESDKKRVVDRYYSVSGNCNNSFNGTVAGPSFEKRFTLFDKTRAIKK